ncbi:MULTISPECIES: glycerophosphodiester phosphodiesterase [unclassified Desulfovibrio]|uniref:glycerophosphodiester phosphodiesterase n=1 Tax=unclassified Desulfovibrio TaxID=2593640 RepID=UPI0013EC9354|nr:MULTISPECIES: glycerophosphodiester phosphodiesterase [unclassified Desulfovibrio]
MPMPPAPKLLQRILFPTLLLGLFCAPALAADAPAMPDKTASDLAKIQAAFAINAKDAPEAAVTYPATPQNAPAETPAAPCPAATPAAGAAPAPAVEQAAPAPAAAPAVAAPAELAPAAPDSAKEEAAFIANAEDAPAAAITYKPAVAAHRGASGYVPEHTLPAKTMAYALGPDFIEQDVIMSKDGVLMIMHDPVLDTTTDVARKFPDRARKDGSFYAVDFTYPELRSLTVTERFNPKTGKPVFAGRFPGDSGIGFQIPTLEEELKLIQGLNKSTGGNVGVYVEVKEPAFYAREGKDITGAVIAMLDKYGYNSPEARSILQIFDYDAVRDARMKGWKGDLAMLVLRGGQHLTDDKAVHEWLLTPEGIAEVSRYATIYAPWFSHLAVPTEDGKGYKVSNLADLARQHGMKVHSWTHRRDAPFKGFKDSRQSLDTAFKEIKLDGLFSDFPGDVVHYLKEQGLR